VQGSNCSAVLALFYSLDDINPIFDLVCRLHLVESIVKLKLKVYYYMYTHKPLFQETNKCACFLYEDI